jgi:hypothetical protein
MFQHFDAAVGYRVQPWHVATIFLSAAAHTVAIAALVRLPDPKVVEWTAEEATYVALMTADPAPPEEAPPPKAESRPAASTAAEEPAPAPPPPTPAPVEAPTELPPIEATLALVNEPEEPRAPSLLGAGAGEGGSLQLDTIAVIEELHLPFAVAAGERFRLPRLRNRELIVSMLRRLYPRKLAYRGLSSAATLRLSIDERGVVDPLSIKIIAFNREEFAYIVMQVARRFRFTPARYRDQNVPVIIDIPVEWVAGP